MPRGLKKCPVLLLSSDFTIQKSEVVYDASNSRLFWEKIALTVAALTDPTEERKKCIKLFWDQTSHGEQCKLRNLQEAQCS
jgi:hypothetical protein